MSDEVDATQDQDYVEVDLGGEGEKDAGGGSPPEGSDGNTPGEDGGGDSEAKKWKVPAAGEVREFTEEELIAFAQKGVDYERKMKALGTWQQIAQLYSTDPGFRDSFDSMLNSFGTSGTASQQDSVYGDSEGVNKEVTMRLQRLESQLRAREMRDAEESIRREYSGMFSEAELNTLIDRAKLSAQGRPLESVFRDVNFREILRAARASGQREVQEKISQNRSARVIKGSGARQPRQKVRLSKEELAAANFLGLTPQEYAQMKLRGRDDENDIISGGGPGEAQY